MHPGWGIPGDGGVVYLLLPDIVAHVIDHRVGVVRVGLFRSVVDAPLVRFL